MDGLADGLANPLPFVILRYVQNDKGEGVLRP